jgi:hypothetical protein
VMVGLVGADLTVIAPKCAGNSKPGGRPAEYIVEFI